MTIVVERPVEKGHWFQVVREVMAAVHGGLIEQCGCLKNNALSIQLGGYFVYFKNPLLFIS